ncbi:MAG: type II toxin-antitoxin system prevent-host-death family antitoxin [candidate division KSB1 bacterium]|nr:type II toxin-antitoxin system prevent-host-death family antitoxin [candidate division KSB1 bacterium]
MEATAKDLRFHSKELLEAVSRGEDVIITYRGKPRAKLIPIDRTDVDRESVDLFAIWEDRDDIKDVNQYVRDQRKGRNL